MKFDDLSDYDAKKLIACRECGELFWEDEPGLIKEPHGEFTQVCPYCGTSDF